MAENAVFHSGRGAQHASRLLARWAAEHHVRLSAGRTGSCHDNAVAESFFATLENEMYHTRSFATGEEAKHAVIEYIEAYYNRKRPHSTIGYRIPAEAMDAFFERTKDGAVRVAPRHPQIRWTRQRDSSSSCVRKLDTGQCWVHILMVIGIIVTAVYGAAVVLRRLGYARRIDELDQDASGTKPPAQSMPRVRRVPQHA